LFPAADAAIGHVLANRSNRRVNIGTIKCQFVSCFSKGLQQPHIKATCTVTGHQSQLLLPEGIGELVQTDLCLGLQTNICKEK
jgi:hypothetical protein